MSVSVKNTIDQKANLIYKIVKFIDWPNESSINAFNVQVIGSYEAFESIQQNLQGKNIQGKPFAVSFAKSVTEATSGNVLIVDEGETLSSAIAQDIAKRPILTISLAPNLSFPSIVTFNETNVQFEVNLHHAQKAGVTVNFQLLQVANRVIK